MGGGRRKGSGVLRDKELKLEHVEASHRPTSTGGWYLRRETCGFIAF